MTDKQTDTKTYNCVYCNKTLAKFETQPLYKDGKFMTTCEECWYKHAKEAGHVVSYVQAITIDIDDLINGNLQDMEFTAQFEVYQQAVKELYDKNVRFKQALNTIAYSDQCNRCDGCGYDNGCMDNNCALYIARKALENDR